MSVRDEILKKRQNMTLTEIQAMAPEETSRMKLNRVIQTIKKGANFIGIGNGTAQTIGISSNSNTNGRENNNELENTSFKESIGFNPSEAYERRIKEKEYLEVAGFKQEDLTLTGEEMWRRKQEDAYFDSIPGYTKKDKERDDER